MKNLFQNRHFSYLLFLGLIIITLSCTDKSAEKKTNIKSAAAAPTEGVFYIDSVYENNDQLYAVIDKIEYEKRTDLSNNSKQDKIELPNGYYIINEKVEPIEKIIADSVIITMQTLNYDEYGNFKFNEKVNLDEFIKTFSNPDNKRYKHIPFKITFSNDRIISIAEIYIP